MRGSAPSILLALAALAATPALAQQQFSGSVSSGRNQLGSSNCPTYAMKMDLTVKGSDISATFQQVGRDPRSFAAKAKADGSFATEAIIGGGDKMKVTGKIREAITTVTGKVIPAEVTVTLDGYCLFEFHLTPKR